MGIRIACLILMVVVTPYNWYTWVFAAGAIVLPYIAVVTANVDSNTRRVERESPERALPSSPTVQDGRSPSEAGTPRVIRVDEQRPLAGSLEGSPSTPPDSPV